MGQPELRHFYKFTEYSKCFPPCRLSRVSVHDFLDGWLSDAAETRPCLAHRFVPFVDLNFFGVVEFGHVKYMGKGLFFELGWGICLQRWRSYFGPSGLFWLRGLCLLLSLCSCTGSKKEGGVRMCKSLFLVMKEECTCGLLLWPKLEGWAGEGIPNGQTLVFGSGDGWYDIDNFPFGDWVG